MVCRSGGELADLCSSKATVKPLSLCDAGSLKLCSHGIHPSFMLDCVPRSGPAYPGGQKIVSTIHHGQIVLSGLRMGPTSRTPHGIKSHFIPKAKVQGSGDLILGYEGRFSVRK